MLRQKSHLHQIDLRFIVLDDYIYRGVVGMAKKSGGKMKLVIVESPTKAKTIKKFLPDDYHVESCMGHVRDLPQSAKDIPESYKKHEWSKLGVNVDKNFEPIYCVPQNKLKIVRDLRGLVKDASEIILATDEDREGESISWHLMELLEPKVPVKRMVFHEITKKAIQKALTEFRDVDTNLVHAQEARRILDRLVGYTISPLLWKKVAFGLSAGRVQSVALRLITEREEQRIRFKKANFFGVYAKNLAQSKSFESRLLSYDGERIAVSRDFDGETGALVSGKNEKIIILDQKNADKISKEVDRATWKVADVEERPVSRKPYPPFITSTLQQDANRKLGLSAKETMQVAQKLYEQGFITYMRTDSTFLSDQAITAARDKIKELYGKNYLPDSPRTYQAKKVKGAQEAHEAIRPSGTEMVSPEDTKLRGIQLSLYELIWKRTVASQMQNAELKQVSVKLEVGKAMFSASGQTVEFPGFLKVYEETKDDAQADEDKEVVLPPLKKGETVKCTEVDKKEHETKPPFRFTEASLVQKMEKEGIGRPSTYASIIGTIIDRGYVVKNSNALVPSFTAMVVSNLLQKYLPKYVDLGFTSEMEKSLDDIADGDLDHIKYLKSIYSGKEGLREQVDKQDKNIKPDEARAIELPGLKSFSFRVGRYGAYVCRSKGKEEQCASIPDSMAPADVTADDANKLIDQKINGTDALGKDPKTKKPIFALSGRFGPYVQLGDAAEEESPKRTSLPPGLKLEDVTLEKALFLLSLPLELGVHSGNDKKIKLGIGRFGPYVECAGDYRSVPKDKPLDEVDLKFAMNLLNQPKKGRGRAAPIKEFGEHPATNEIIQLFEGKYGPYLKCGKVNASLPDDIDIKKLDKDKVIEILNEKMEVKKSSAKSSPGGGKKSKALVKAAKKSTEKSKLKVPEKSIKNVDVSGLNSKSKPSKSGVKKRANATQ